MNDGIHRQHYRRLLHRLTKFFEDQMSVVSNKSDSHIATIAI
jgi:hypothetical protein